MIPPGFGTKVAALVAATLKTRHLLEVVRYLSTGERFANRFTALIISAG